jgi:general secretion pathway protein L
MPEKILGLDIGTDSIKVVQVTGGARDPRITNFTTVSVKGEEGLAHALKAMFEDERFKSDTAIASIDSASFFYRNVKIPFDDPKKIRKIVSFELEPFLPFPIERLLVDYMIVSQGDKTEILTAAIERDKIRSYLEMLQPYRIEPKIVDIDSVSLAVSIIEKTDEADGIVLDIGNLRTTLIQWKHKTIHLVRSLPFGGHDITRAIADQLNIDSVDAETLKRSLGGTASQDEGIGIGQVSGISETLDVNIVKNIANKALVRLCVMVNNTMRAFSAQHDYDDRPAKAYLNGGGILVPEAKEIISRSLEVAAEYVDLRADIPIQPGEKDSKSVWCPEIMNNALALALRGYRKGKGFNFRQEEFEIRGNLIRYKKEVINLAAALAVIVICMVVNASTDFYLFKKRYEKLNSAITQVFKDTLPDITRIVNPVQQLRVRISEEKTKKGLLSGSAGETRIMDLLRDISIFIPDAMDFKIDTIVFDPDMIQINGDTDNFNTVDSIKNGLQKSSYFGSVDISSAKLDSSGTRVEFKLILSRQKKVI